MNKDLLATIKAVNDYKEIALRLDYLNLADRSNIPILQAAREKGL